jgi:DNA-binding NarL/FixJ family response regulator
VGALHVNIIDRRAIDDPEIRSSLLNGHRDARETTDQALVFVVIDSRKLERECFVRVIEASSRRIAIAAYESVHEWREAADLQEPCAILMNIGGRRVSEPAVCAEIEGLVHEAGPTPVIVMAESEEFREMIAAVDSGARGYIPSSVGADVIVEAAHLTSAGGIFLPVSSVLALRDAILKKVERPRGIEEHFTSRQAAVADALRRGKANKTIAYELNMCESTVKVHIRTIMKKLRATNRTQAAFKLNALFPREQSAAAEVPPAGVAAGVR